MCKALFTASSDPASSGPEDTVGSAAAAAVATAAGAAAAGTSSQQCDIDAPRHRRPRPCVSRECEAAIAAGLDHSFSSSSGKCVNNTGATVSLGGLGGNGSGGGPLGEHAAEGGTFGSTANCGHSWPQSVVSVAASPCACPCSQQQKQQHSRENCSFERAMAVGRIAWGGGKLLLLRLLRRRPRSVPSHSGETSAAMLSRCTLSRRGDSFSLLPLSLSRKESRPSLSRWSSTCCLKAFRVFRGMGFMLLVLSALSVALLAVVEIYIRTYRFQVRAMERVQGPRGECPIVKLTRESPGGWGVPDDKSGFSGARVATSAVTGGRKRERHDRRARGFGETSAEEREERKLLRFGIVLMCDDGMWPGKYTEMSIANKKAYAALHGYDVIVATNADVDRSRPAAWSKLLVLEKHLADYDYLIFVDIDAFIMNPSFKLEWILDMARKQQETGDMEGWGDPDREADLIVTRDWNGPNSGVFVVKNSDFSLWLLREWWNQEQLAHGDYPFKYEQRGMHFLLQPDSWREAGLPYYADYALVRTHTVVIDQCAMNSYLVHPWQVLRGRTKHQGKAASYVAGDFILHFAGRKGRVRQDLVDYYYPLAVKAAEEYSKRIEGGDPDALRTSKLTALGDPEDRQRQGRLSGGRLP